MTIALLSVNLTSFAQLDTEEKGTYLGAGIEFLIPAELVPTLTFQAERHLLYAGPKIVFLYINGVDLGYSYFFKKNTSKFDLFINYDFQYGKNLLILFILCPSHNNTR